MKRTVGTCSKTPLHASAAKVAVAACPGLIAAVTVAVFWPVLHNGFIDYDDTDYVTVNMMVRQGLTLKGLSVVLHRLPCR